LLQPENDKAVANATMRAKVRKTEADIEIPPSNGIVI